MSHNESLKNKTIVITRPLDTGVSLKSSIEQTGGYVILFPTIKIVPTDNWETCDSAITDLEQFNWIVFSSQNSAHFFLERLMFHRKKIGIQRIGVIGEKTAQYLLSRKLSVNLIPGIYSASGFLAEISRLNLEKNKFLLPSSNIARHELEDGLSEMGHKVLSVEVYKTMTNYEVDTVSLKRKLRANGVDCITFYSPSAFTSFLDLMDSETLQHIKQTKLALASIGKTTTAAIEGQGYTVHICADKSTDEWMMEALKKYFGKEDDNHVTLS